MALDRAAERPYGHKDLGSHYQRQTDATESRYEGGPAQPVRLILPAAIRRYHSARCRISDFQRSSSSWSSP